MTQEREEERTLLLSGGQPNDLDPGGRRKEGYGSQGGHEDAVREGDGQERTGLLACCTRGIICHPEVGPQINKYRQVDLGTGV